MGEIDRRMDVLAAVVLVKSGKGRVASVCSREISKTLQAKFENFAWRVFEISREYTEATRPLPLLTNTTAAKMSILRSISPVVL